MNDRSQIDTRTSGSAATPMAEGGALVRPPTDETGEHSGRYAHVAGRFTVASFATYALDHRGHLQSSGPRALIDRMDHAVTDVDSLVTLAAARDASRPSRMVHDRAGSPDRTLRLYDGLYHELLNEPERRIVLGDITTWLDAPTVPHRADAQGLHA